MARVPTENPRIDAATWVTRHGDALFRFALVRVRDEATAEDLVHQRVTDGN